MKLLALFTITIARALAASSSLECFDYDPNVTPLENTQVAVIQALSIQPNISNVKRVCGSFGVSYCLPESQPPLVVKYSTCDADSENENLSRIQTILSKFPPNGLDVVVPICLYAIDISVCPAFVPREGDIRVTRGLEGKVIKNVQIMPYVESSTPDLTSHVDQALAGDAISLTVLYALGEALARFQLTYFNPETGLTVAHGDFYPRNIIYKNDGTFSLIDALDLREEMSFVVDPLYFWCFVTHCSGWKGSKETVRQAMEQFYRGYLTCMPTHVLEILGNYYVDDIAHDAVRPISQASSRRCDLFLKSGYNDVLNEVVQGVIAENRGQ